MNTAGHLPSPLRTITPRMYKYVCERVVGAPLANTWGTRRKTDAVVSASRRGANSRLYPAHPESSDGRSRGRASLNYIPDLFPYDYAAPLMVVGRGGQPRLPVSRHLSILAIF